MSPSIWWDHRSILTIVNRTEPRPELKIWLDVGTAEGARHVRDTELLARLLEDRGWRSGVDLCFLKAEGAVHSEDAWSARFDQALRFLFASAKTKDDSRMDCEKR
jgi:predicted alpha/beta superfamily hydrolase